MLIALALTAVLLSWLWRAPASLTFSGWFQGDTPTYICYGRMAAETATTLSYANPHDLRVDPPPLLVNLPISSIGWLLELGVSTSALEHVMRVLFGALMYLALGLLLRSVFRPGPWFWGAFVIVGLGSGSAWLVSLFQLDWGAAELADHWRDGVSALESPYYWWFLDTFRNLMYPLELVYHGLIFAQLAMLGTGRWKSSIIFCALACLSNPFAGIQASGVQAGALVLACMRRPRPSMRVLAASAAVIGVFGLYYGAILPMDDAIRSVQEQHQANLDAALGLESLVVGHGLALLAPLVLIFDAGFRRHAWQRFTLMPVLVLALWTLVLSQNSRLGIEWKLMPMHFTRGYMHASLWIVLLAWLQYRVRGTPMRAAAVVLALALFTLPDTLLFVEDQYTTMPHRNSLVWSPDFEAVHDYLRRQPEPLHIVAHSWTLGRQICALHEQHRSAFGTPLTTPHYTQRRAALGAFKRDPSHEPPLIRWADVQVANADDAPWLRALRSSPRWNEVFCNRTWCVFRRSASQAP